MAYGTAGLEAALSGVSAVNSAGGGPYLSLHTADPTTTGGGEDTTVVRQAASFGAPVAGEMVSAEVPFAIVADDQLTEPRVYTHFGVWSASTAGEFLCGGGLDETESFSPNGGTYNFTATLTAASA